MILDYGDQDALYFGPIVAFVRSIDSNASEEITPTEDTSTYQGKTRRRYAATH